MLRPVDHQKNLDDHVVYTEKQLCSFTGMSSRTAQKHRQDGTGPAYIQLSARRIGYRGQDIRAWLESRTVRSTADATIRFKGAA